MTANPGVALPPVELGVYTFWEVFMLTIKMVWCDVEVVVDDDQFLEWTV